MKIKRCVIALSLGFMLLLASCTPKIVVTPSPIGIEVMPATPEICVESAVPDITVSPVGEMPYQQRYTEKLVITEMRNRKYSWLPSAFKAEYQGEGLWLVTVSFKDAYTVRKVQYVFNERCNCE